MLAMHGCGGGCRFVDLPLTMEHEGGLCRNKVVVVSQPLYPQGPIAPVEASNSRRCHAILSLPSILGFPSGSAQEGTQCGHSETAVCLIVSDQQMYILYI